LERRGGGYRVNVMHAAHPAGFGGGDVGLDVIDEHALGRIELQAGGGMQEDLRLRLAHANLTGDHHRVEQAGEVGPRVLIAAPGVGQQRGTHARLAQRADQLVHRRDGGASREHPREQAVRDNRGTADGQQPGREDRLELVVGALAAFQSLHRVRSSLRLVRPEDPRAHDRDIAVPVDALSLNPSLNRRQDRRRQHASPVGNDATNCHVTDFRCLNDIPENSSHLAHEGSMTSQNVSGARYNREHCPHHVAMGGPCTRR
jgi:hypothetical protein